MFSQVSVHGGDGRYLWPHVLSGGGVGMSWGWVLTPLPCRIQGTWDTTGYGQVGGMHSTGMLSCYFYRPQRSCGKVMFSQASVILSTGGGGVWQTPPG